MDVSQTTAGWVANNIDPDQKLHSLASYLGLHCLLRHVSPNTYGKHSISFFKDPVLVSVTSIMNENLHLFSVSMTLNGRSRLLLHQQYTEEVAFLLLCNLEIIKVQLRWVTHTQYIVIQDRQRDRQTDRQTERERERERETHTERHTHNILCDSI